MVCNYLSNYRRFFSKLGVKYIHFEIVNYLFIIEHQILLISRYYKSITQDSTTYGVIKPEDTTKLYIKGLG